MTTTTVSITGMTCGHCEASVREELGELEGVTDVQASHTDGSATIESAAPLDEKAIRAAVEEAGYAVTGIH